MTIASEASTTSALRVRSDGQLAILHGEGNGPLDALTHALALGFDILSYEQHSMGRGSDAKSVAFVEIATPGRVTLWGAGIHENIVTASILAVLSAVNRALKRGVLDQGMQPAVAG